MKAGSPDAPPTPRSPGSADAARLLHGLAPLLTAASPEEALPDAIRLIGALSGARLAGLVLLRKHDVQSEHWDGEEPVRIALRGEFVRSTVQACTERTGSVREVDSAAGKHFLWTTPFAASGAEPLGAVTLAFPNAPVRDGDFDASVVERLVEMFATRVAAGREAAAHRAEKARYERWFRTLDSQLRLLDRERQKFVAVVNQSDTHMVVVNAQCEVQWVNNAMAARLERSRLGASWVGRSLTEVWDTLEMSAPSCGSEACPVTLAFRDNRVVHEEMHLANGVERRNLYLTALPIKGPDGSAEEVLLMIQDLSDLEVLRRSETRYRHLFERSPDAMIMVEPASGRLALANPVASRLTGWSPRELAGLSVEMLHEPADWPHARTVYEEVFARPDPVTTECILRTKDGERLVANMTATRFELEGQAVALVEFQDVTDRKRLESELRHSQKMDAIGRLAGGVAHDFNNILTIILGQSELMLNKLGEGDRLRRTAESIEKAAVRGSLLTRQLLAFSRKELVKHEIVDLRAAFAGIESMLRTLIGEDVELIVHNEGDECRVRADRGQIEQVVMNLAVNARDAMPQGGQLTVDIRREEAPVGGRGEEPGPVAVLRVTDTGLGMDAATKARLFEPFFTTKAQGKGTGLGLSSAYGIVREAGGDIAVASQPGQGTTFTIRFPLVIEEGGIAERVSRVSRILSREQGNARGTECILLVEDEDDVRELATEALEMNGYSVHAAASADDAIDQIILYDVPIDLILTDVIMPGLSGGELAQRVTACRPSARVLYMSGYNDDAIVRHGVSDSDAAFIQKPFTIEGLTTRVREILDQPATLA